MARIIFLRHGETKYNVELEHNSPLSKIGGRTNWLSLTKRGEAQAAVAGHYMRDANLIPDVWYSSPALRAVATGAIVMDILGLDLKPVIDNRLQEMSQGVAEGEFRDKIWTPERSKEAIKGGMDFKLTEGESLSEVLERKKEVVSQIFSEHTVDETILITGHGMAIRCLAAGILGWSRDEILSKSNDTPNCSLTGLSQSGSEIVVDYYAKDLIGEVK